MPNINRIRVNNIRYNFGTQFYDDFVMRFDGKNALYDLANGGGKSVLMLLLFQNLIPNCTLDDKQPIEKLFRTNEGSTTIHSLIEWNLSKNHIRDGYKYMLTGFCARKAKDDDDEKNRGMASIDYFNYVIFYRQYNDNDIVNLPLIQGKERVTYTGLRSYLKELGHKDYQLEVHVFDRKGEYQHFISQYGLYESEWEILRGINKTEGHVRTYFENNYKTTRKVVEDLLIEGIIQKSFLNQIKGDEDGDAMAGTLIGINDKLLELSNRKTEILGYGGQVELLDKFCSRIQTMIQLYDDTEQFKLELVKLYNTIEIIKRKKEWELQTAEKSLESYKIRVAETNRKQDTIKVQIQKQELRKIEEEVQGLEKIIASAKAKQTSHQEEIDLREGANDYLDYLAEEKESQGLKAIIEASASGESVDVHKLYQYAGLKHRYYEEKCKKLEEEQNYLKKQYAEWAVKLKKYQDQEQKSAVICGIKSSQVEQFQRQKEQVLGSLREAQSEIGLLVTEHVGSEMSRLDKIRQQLLEELKELQKRQQELEENNQQLILKYETTQVVKQQLEEKKKGFLDFFEAYTLSKERADRLLEVYDAQTYENLKISIEQRYKRMIIDMNDKKNQMTHLKQYLEKLEEKNPVQMTKNAAEVMDYLRRYDNVTCIFGSDYLAEMDAYNKESLLEKLPFLPYSVIVQKGFSKIGEDRLLFKKDFGDVLVPVVSLENVMEQKGLINTDQVKFVGKNLELYHNEETIRQEQKQAQKTLDEEERKLKRLKDAEETYKKDLQYIMDFVLREYKEYQTQMKEKIANEEKLEKYQKLLTAYTEKIHEIQEEKERCIEERLKKEETLATTEEKGKTLENIKDISQQVLEIQGSIEAAQKILNEEKEKYERNHLSQREAKKQIADISDRCQSKETEVQKLNQQWQQMYKEYYRADICADDDIEETVLDAQFIGLKEHYENEFMDMADKKTLLARYEKSMEKTMERIKARKTSVEYLEALNKAGNLTQTSVERLNIQKEETQSIQKEIQKKTDELERQKTLMYQLEGRIANAVSVIEERYGLYKEVENEQTALSTAVENYRQYLKEYQIEIERLNRVIETGYKTRRYYEEIKKEIERLMYFSGAVAGATKESYGEDLLVKKKMEELRASFEHLKELQQLRTGDFEKERLKTIDDLKALDAIELADELNTGIKTPKTKEDAAFLMNSMRDTIRLILLEKERIEKTILDMQKIKDNFENQCLQRCSHIRTELERLPRLSKITLDHENIQMLNLRIPYIKEEFWKQEMASYIDQTVKAADHYKDIGERLRYIRDRLSWKKLFSVIVSDMNAIRLSLYKRERIKEQSRFLKYEEAVGSTGQSQGIYIQFLIAIVNYIASVYSGESQDDQLKKVIFIDNPFGAAKDIYIWEPIFELLKTNNVQLIVPARGATPAITGRFDVNYVLGQKVMNGKQQTVVVDFHSKVQIEETEYIKMDFEQEVFDFL